MEGLQDRGATAIQTSWPIILLLWKLLLPNVSSFRLLVFAELRRSFRLTNHLGTSAALLHQGVKCSQYVSRGCNLVPAQQGFMLTFSW